VSDGPVVWIGVLTFDVLTPGARSLKEKRSLVRPIVDRARSRFEVSVARLDGLDRLDRETLGVSVLSSDPEVCRRLLERAHDFAASFGLRLEGTSLEVERWS
jgi:uncharacterized protein YlxP (DUF503 family)